MTHRPLLLAFVITSALFVGCAAPPPKPAGGLADLLERPAERALVEGIRAYDDGSYAVAEDALRMGLDFTGSVSVPSVGGNSSEPDWSNVQWSSGFRLDLALNRYLERNNYRSSLITLDVQIRAREQSQDSIQSQIRSALRNIQAAFDSYTIQVEALKVAELRVESTSELYSAGRTNALDVLDAKDSLLSAQLSLTAAIVDYSMLAAAYR